MKKSERFGQATVIGSIFGFARQVSHLHPIAPPGGLRAGRLDRHPPAPPNGLADLPPGVAHETRHVFGPIGGRIAVAPRDFPRLDHLFATAKAEPAVWGQGKACKARFPGAPPQGLGE